MLPVHTILHPTDFSQHADYALRLAGSLARDLGARVIEVHVAPLATVFCAVRDGGPTDLETYRHTLDKHLRQIQMPGLETPGERQSREDHAADNDRHHPNGTTAPEMLVEHRPRVGSVATEILRTAEDVGADLIVMGTHGRSGVGRLLLGSEAEAVLRRARCPVLTVKAPIPGPGVPATPGRGAAVHGTMPDRPTEVTVPRAR